MENKKYISAADLEELAKSKTNCTLNKPYYNYYKGEGIFFRVCSASEVKIDNMSPFWVLHDGTCLVCDVSWQEHHGVDDWIKSGFIMNDYEVEGWEENSKELYASSMWGAIRIRQRNGFHGTNDTICIIFPKSSTLTQTQISAIQTILENYYNNDTEPMELWDEYPPYDILLIADDSIRTKTPKDKLLRFNTDDPDYSKEIIKKTMNNIIRFSNTNQFINPGIDETLLESKQDEEAFRAVFGDELTNKYLSIRQKLKSPENDFYYWIKKNNIEELTNFLTRYKSNTVKREDAKKGAVLLATIEGWKLYRIDTYEAAALYGKGTKWCITGNADHDTNGGEYWFNYYKDNECVKNYYFIISPTDEKWCYLELEFDSDSWDSTFINHQGHAATTELFWKADDTNPGLATPLGEITNIPRELLEKLPGINDNYINFIFDNKDLKFFRVSADKKTLYVSGKSYQFFGVPTSICDCTIIENVVLEEGVSSVLAGAFDNFYNLKTITLPSTISDYDILSDNSQEDVPTGAEVFSINRHYNSYPAIVLKLTKETYNNFEKEYKQWWEENSDWTDEEIEDHENPLDWDYFKLEFISAATQKKLKVEKLDDHEAAAIKKFGTTNDYIIAGYLTKSGYFIKFGEEGYIRGTDHKGICAIYDDDEKFESGGAYMIDFMREGNIRLIPERPGIDLIKEPTRAQYTKLYDYISYFWLNTRKGFILEISDQNGYTIGYKEYDEATGPSKIISDIRKYFAGVISLSFKVEEGLKENLLIEKTRDELVNKSKHGDNYKHPHTTRTGKLVKNRWEARDASTIANRADQYNQINMQDLWKNDILNLGIHVYGKTDEYVVTIRLNGVVKEIKNQVALNNNKFEFKTVWIALCRVMNTGNVYLSCSCPDWQYRHAYISTQQDYNSGKPENRPSNITNPNDTLGAGCKHINSVLSNINWVKATARVINNYAHWMEKNDQRKFADYIFPKIFGMPYQKAVQLSLFDVDDDLKSDEETIALSNDYGRTRTQFKKKGEE